MTKLFLESLSYKHYNSGAKREALATFNCCGKSYTPAFQLNVFLPDHIIQIIEDYVILQFKNLDMLKENVQESNH